MVEFYTPLLIGIFIVGVTAFDFFYTTLSFNGAGFINRVATAALSSFFLFWNRHTSTRNALRFSGLSHILVSIVLWIGLLWTGLFLILSGSSTSVLHAISGEPAGLINKLYFSGYTLSTLGNGEFVPASKSWQLVVAVFSFSGFIFLTTGMSYLLNLTSAVLHKRSLSLYISNMGEYPEEIVANTYSNGSFSGLTKLVSSLQEKINRHNQNHFAYPISHYFYSTSRTESLTVNLSSLDEALTIIQCYVKKDSSVESDLRPLRDAIDKFLETVQYSFITKLKDHEDVSPDVEKLSKLGVSLVSRSTVDKESSVVENRRSLLSGYLKSSGWSWEDVYYKGCEQTLTLNQ